MGQAVFKWKKKISKDHSKKESETESSQGQCCRWGKLGSFFFYWSLIFFSSPLPASLLLTSTLTQRPHAPNLQDLLSWALISWNFPRIYLNWKPAKCCGHWERCRSMTWIDKQTRIHSYGRLSLIMDTMCIESMPPLEIGWKSENCLVAQKINSRKI